MQKKGNGFTETVESDGFKIKVYHIEGKNFIGNAIYNKELYNICEQYDIIQSSDYDQIASWNIYRKFPEKTIIYHGPYKSKYTKKYNIRSKIFDIFFLHRYNYKKAHIITKSKLAEGYLRKKGFKNITTAGVGLNPYYLEQNVEIIPEKISNLQKHKGKNKYILYVGAISKRKNFKFMLQIMNEIVNVRNMKDYKLIVVGNKIHKEQKYYDDCFKFINENNLKENIINLQTVEQKYLKYIYGCSDIYALPTQYDIFGMVYLEAMYFGVPIITTFCGGSSLLIKENENGFIRNLNDYKEWANVIINITNDSVKMSEIANKSKKEINENYLWSKVALKFENNYKKILNKK